MTELIEGKQEIEKIIENRIKGKRLIFTEKYKIGIIKKTMCHPTL